MPRECAINGCCIITGKKGSAAFFEDIPIKNKYKFLDNDKSIPDIVATIRWSLKNYEQATTDFDDYRKKSDAEYDRLYELGRKLGKKYKPRRVNKRKLKKDTDFAKLYNAITDLKDDVHSILEYIENYYAEDRWGKD